MKNEKWKVKDIGAITKDQKNQAQGFKFRGIDQFVNALYPALTKHGVFMTPRAVQFNQELKDVVRSSGKTGVDKHVSILMEYDFFAEDGSKVTVGPIPAEGVDSGDKATNKALSAALKYALIQTFSVPTEDMAEADLETLELGRSTSKPLQNNSTTLNALNNGETLIATTTAVVTPLKKSNFRKTKPALLETATTTATSVETAGNEQW